MNNELKTAHGTIQMPAFLPDATRGIVKFVDSDDLSRSKVEALVVNTLHLSSNPGISAVKRNGGIHKFMGWNRPVISDSGGFQVLSLAQGSDDLVTITAKGFQYRRNKKDKKHLLTPEKCIQQQFDLGSDVMFCLDYCTHPDAPPQTQQRSVELTIEWARRCKNEYNRRLVSDARDSAPLLFAVVQGGTSRELRTQCAESLLEIGFDGYGFGGWPIDDDGKLLDMVGFVASLLPADAPKHGLGIGKPENIVAAYVSGYRLFDCVLPTRDARHGRVYVFDSTWTDTWTSGTPPYSYLYIKDEDHIGDSRPFEQGCDCIACQNYTRGYIRHLFHINDPTGARLATLHNLRFYTRLVDGLRVGAMK
jgi:queuine tRNA-ribosyltransferase